MKLPSQKHPDYPQATYWTEEGRNYIKGPSIESIQLFFIRHPEFSNEGSYEFHCGCCGATIDEDHNYCQRCDEHSGEWEACNDDGEPIECIHCSDTGYLYQQGAAELVCNTCNGDRGKHGTGTKAS